jgi:hypothetical protein
VTYIGPDGKPDFRVHVEVRRRLVAIERRCQLCGERFGDGEEITFVGFEASLNGLIFGEPPMHRSCFDYARTVCPWLGGDPVSGRPHDPEVSVAVRPYDPATMMVYTTRSFVAAGFTARAGSGA